LSIYRQNPLVNSKPALLPHPPQRAIICLQAQSGECTDDRLGIRCTNRRNRLSHSLCSSWPFVFGAVVSESAA